MLDDIRLDDPITPPFPFLYCKTPDTFPFETAVRRWPSILTSVVNDVYKTLGDGSDPRTRQAKDIIAEVGKLRHEVMRDMTLRSIEDDGDVDVKLWNEVLEHWWQDPADRTFFKAPWLFAECYLYRRVREIFAKRSNPDPALDWGSYDPFASQKDATLKASLQSFAVMAEKLEFLLAQAQSDDIGAHETTFQELLMSSLWGNQVDLSLHSNTSAHGMQEDTRAHLEKMKEKIIVDDSRILWKLLLSSPRGKTVDIILDNAGFELLTDLLLAHFLIATKVCARVRFFGKAQPWFVSDTTRRDFLHTCATLSGLDAHSAESNPAVSSIAHTWSLWIAEGTWEFHAPLLFTTPYSYWHLKTANPGLYSTLLGDDSPSILAIFKGDLNYRKLVYDISWPTNTEFSRACGPLADGLRVPLVAIRTAKANVAVGLAEGQEERLRAIDPNWMVNGNWGIINCLLPR